MVTVGILPFRENSHGRTGNRTWELMISRKRLSLISLILYLLSDNVSYPNAPRGMPWIDEMYVLYVCMYLLYYVCIAVFTLDAGLLARSQYSEGSATGHLNTGFSWFPCVYKQMLRWFPRFQFATTCFSCSRPDLNLL